jgi:hypothetical protein
LYAAIKLVKFTSESFQNVLSDFIIANPVAAGRHRSVVITNVNYLCANVSDNFATGQF